MSYRVMTESFFKDKRITVFGLGLNMGGVGTVEFLAKQGVREIIVTDIKSREELGASLEKLSKYKHITYALGQHRPEDFTSVDMVIKNPVISWTNEYIKLAQKHNVPVEMDSSLFFSLCKTPIIGVTGTKGKTTTATLIAHILEFAGKKVARVGIGQTGVLGRLLQAQEADVVVFELSSWRLSALMHSKKSPVIAVFTNIHPDHLNYYKTMDAYIADKKNIFLFQKTKDILVANFDDQVVREAAQEARGGLVWFSERNGILGDGVWSEQGQIWVHEKGVSRELLPWQEILLLGEHNKSNVLAGAAAALAFGTPFQKVAKAIRCFPGVPHRLEYIGEKKNVRYYNDTAATIPEAAVMALRSFAEPVILIAGGSDKCLSFDSLAEEILKKSKGLVLFAGEGTEKLLAALKKRLPETEKNRPFEIVETMQKAVELASRNAESGDIVLLSPGAASFGLFKNEFDRGEQFRACVREL